MNRLAWIAVVALAGLVPFLVGDLVNPVAVPVAQAVELTGTAPADRPPPEGFFIVPPRIVDFRDDADGDDDSTGSSESSSDRDDATDDSFEAEDDEAGDDDDQAGDDQDDPELDETPDDTPDDPDDGDDDDD